MIPTVNERDELKEAYKEAYGEADWEYLKEDYDMMEFRLLNDAYKEKFNNDGFEMPQGDFNGSRFPEVRPEQNAETDKFGNRGSHGRARDA